MSDSNFLTVGGQTSFDMPLAFRAQAAVVNNLSNQWVELLDANDTFVPPYIVNMIVPVGGATRFRGSFASPTGIPQAATIAGQRVTVEVYETPLQPNAGQLFPVRAPSTEWRNPKNLNFRFFTSNVGPHPITNRWSYTVPTGRRARLDLIQTETELETAGDLAVTNAVGYAESTIGYQPSGAGSLQLIDAFVQDVAPARSRASVALASSMEFGAGDFISGATDNLYTATLATHFVSAKIVEGDA